MLRSFWIGSLLLPVTLATTGSAIAQKRAVTLDDLGTRSSAHFVSPVWAPDEKQFAYVDDDQLYLYDIAAKSRTAVLAMSQLEKSANKSNEPEIEDWTNRRVTETPIQWFTTRDRLLVSAGGDLFVVRISNKRSEKSTWEQLTRTPYPEYDPKLSPDNRYVSFRRAHDLYVLEIASQKITKLTSDGSETLLNAELDWVYPEELDLGTAHWWSPDSSHIAFLQLDTHREPAFPQVALLQPASMPEPERFPKAGDPNADARLGVVAVTGGPVQWMDLGETKDRLLARVTWLPNSQAVAAMRLNRVQNRLDLLQADIRTGRAKTLIHEEDPFWINVKDEPYFFSDGRGFLWESERDGYRHLYLYDPDGQLKEQLDKGDWEIDKLFAVDERKGQAYFVSSEGSPIENALYALNLADKNRRLLTAMRGTHGISVSPKGMYFTDVASNTTTPPRQTLRTGNGEDVVTLTDADTERQNKFALSVPEIVQVPSGDGETLYARLLRPANFDPTKKYPVIVQIYGGPGAQAVHNAWSGVNSEQVYAARGFVVWQLDNRGSIGRGHKWESAIFRNMGARELQDQEVGIAFLKKYPWVDGSRIGLTGWSYGGYMTLYSLVNAPDLFRAGVAGAPVTHWRNYDSIYTERYMGLPDDEKDAYERSSPQTHAANLKAKLLIIHNIEDDNVHFSNSLQMAAALERANKQFRMLIYPQKTHGVTGDYAKNLSASVLAFFEENLK